MSFFYRLSDYFWLILFLEAMEKKVTILYTVDQIKKEEPFSSLSLYKKHDPSSLSLYQKHEPEEPAGEVAIQTLCEPLKEWSVISDLSIGLKIWALWPADKLYYKAVIVKIQDPKLKKGRIFCIWEK